MQYQELLQTVKNLEIATMRSEEPAYFEGVFKKDWIEKLVNELNGMFGQPAWPSKTQLSSQIQTEIKEYGGISSGQTLYYLAEAQDTLFVMLWPWSDGVHTTVKIVKK